LGIATFTNSFAYAINDLGQVAGYGLTNYANQGALAFIGTASGSAAIPMPANWVWDSNGEFGFAVNDIGQVAGRVSGYELGFSPEPEQAFFGTAATSATFIPSGWFYGSGNAINDAGVVCGSVENSTGTTEEAFVGNGVFQFSGWSNSYCYALNDSGDWAGNGYNGAASQAFFDGAPIPLPTGATLSSVYLGSLNNSGFVVGNSDAGGWIWDATDGTVLLNSLLAVSGWNVYDAISISNNGLILAIASYEGGPQQYVELSAATPEPGTFILAGAGLLLAAFVYRKRYRTVG
jgi:hypothetical protein